MGDVEEQSQPVAFSFRSLNSSQSFEEITPIITSMQNNLNHYVGILPSTPDQVARDPRVGIYATVPATLYLRTWVPARAADVLNRCHSVANCAKDS